VSGGALLLGLMFAVVVIGMVMLDEIRKR